jgi:hypothetical protein
VPDVRSEVEKSLQQRRAVLTSWSNTIDRTARTEPARRKRLENLADKIDPNHDLPDEVRERLAQDRRKAELLGYSERAAAKRRKAKKNGNVNAKTARPNKRTASLAAEHRTQTDARTA